MIKSPRTVYFRIVEPSIPEIIKLRHNDLCAPHQFISNPFIPRSGQGTTNQFPPPSPGKLRANQLLLIVRLDSRRKVGSDARVVADE